jgi:hypothetical protein
VPPIMGPIRASASSTTNTIRSLRLSFLMPSHLPLFDRLRLRTTIWRGGRTIITLKWNRRWNRVYIRSRSGDYSEASRPRTIVDPEDRRGHVLLRGQPKLPRLGYRLGATAHAELSEDVSDVLLDGIDGDEELPGYLPI